MTCAYTQYILGKIFRGRNRVPHCVNETALIGFEEGLVKMNKNNDFGRYLTKLREQSGYDSQRQLALAAKVSPATISRIEAGLQRAEPSTLEKLAHCLNVSLQQLMAAAGYLSSDDLDKLPPDIRKIARAGQRMTPEQREKWLKVTRTLYPEAFKD